MKNQFMSIVKARYVVFHKVRREGEVAGSQIEQGSHICLLQQVKWIGV